MKRKFIVGILMALSIFSIGCESLETSRDKEVIVIEENVVQTNNNKDKIGVNLISKVEISRETKEDREDENGNYKNYHFRNSLIESIYNENYSSGLEIEKMRFGRVKTEKDSEGFNIIEWKDLEVTGRLVNEWLSDDFRIVNDDKVYKLTEDGILKEIEGYRKVPKGKFNLMTQYRKSSNYESDILYFVDTSSLGIVDIKTNNYLEINDSEDYNQISKYRHNVISLDKDKVYLEYITKSEDGKSILNIGYIQNNKFYNIFENENFNIESYYNDHLIEDMGGFIISVNETIIQNNKVLFAGIVNDVNGLWNYDMETKKLNLEMEFERNLKVSIHYNPNKENIILETNIEKANENEIEFADYIVKINKNLEIEQMGTIFTAKEEINEDGLYMSRKVFMAFSDEGNRVYYWTNIEEDRYCIEVYDINQ